LPAAPEVDPAPTAQDAAAQLKRAVGYMLASTMLFGSMAILIRLAAAELHAFEIAFFRNFFGLVAALPILYRHGFSILRTDKLSLYFMRCVIGIVSMLSGFWALVHLPLAQAVALSYSTPLFITIGAVFVLGEVVRARRWSAVVIGFIGVLVVLQPGSADFTLGTLVALLSALMSAAVAISIKFLSRTESPDTIVMYTTLIWVPLSLLPALPFWTWPSPIVWLWVALAGFVGTGAHMLWTRANHLADASVIAPISFMQLPVVALLAWLVFGETVGMATVLGASIIFASNFYIARREAMLARRTVTDPDIVAEQQRGS
jgi:drug/metabolite transporter (DMT)-like permease